MAAKVAMVAVPAVLGIASIRVHTASEAPAGGLASRDGLNVYTPLPETSPAQFLPERPGVVERGIAAAREGTLPAVRAVKSACVSVKRGSVNLYRAGEDAYYYLIDPPPGFLPRFGTITMAGLLGMFLARRGSRFRRVLVPLGLMSVGASVCYPAQAVALLKVTGRSALAAGQWSRAAASSLLSANKEPAAEQTQSAPGSSPGSLAQTTAVPESVSDEAVVTVAAEDESSVPPTEISAAWAPAEGGSGSAADSSQVRTETPPLSEETAPAGHDEGSGRKQAAGDVSDTRPAEPTSGLELETRPVPVVESAEREPSADPELTPAEEPTPTTPPPPPFQPAAENSKEGSGFKPNPALMDFGQSSPEDEDLYSTRS
ncbi:MICOS complex subunit MIC27 isoform X1 [Kryptolebias marmoratus]|uniref:MICOS complex subunit n=1 Tax=Kryptolebias marmoratus TaxID=37003 RepID=A0A3Q3AXK8_KRYMA|nr:MICOS complex subunit MIC27 isoform X1 [Kryptolebias marmoratus]